MQIAEQLGPSVPRWLVGFDLRRRPHLEADVLIVGGGVAGLSAALAAADAGAEVLVLVKGTGSESNTAWAQGGVAGVLATDERADDDTIESHVRDTLVAGAGLCDEAAVRGIVGEGGEALAWLRGRGCRFDLAADGRVLLTREGGHATRRIVHANGDRTGAEVARALGAACTAHPRITVVENAFALDLITDDGRVKGVLYHRRDELVAALAGATILATGGCGALWRETTNPAAATGDGLAMAYRAGAVIADAEFMQFHPTTLYIAGVSRLLITEAMRGEGALLRNHAGERFMPGYHPDAELAPRDVVARAIVAEVRRTGFPHVWLDATHLGSAFLHERFPSIHQACAGFGIDIATEWIPVHPSAHYHCGGVLTDDRGATGLSGLWAAGEVGCTGLHGANRLASNSLLEGLVVGRRAGLDAAAAGGAPGRVRVAAEMPAPASSELNIADLVSSLRATMWRQIGIERSGDGLRGAKRAFAFWLQHQARGCFRSRDGWELANQLQLGQIVAAAAEARTASVGTHLRTDSRGDIDPVHRAYRRPA